jgi:hypothetical protein
MPRPKTPQLANVPGSYLWYTMVQEGGKHLVWQYRNGPACGHALHLPLNVDTRLLINSRSPAFHADVTAAYTDPSAVL